MFLVPGHRHASFVLHPYTHQPGGCVRVAGRMAGRIEGEANVLQRLLTRRFGPLPQETLSRLKADTAAQLETWSLNLLDAPTLDHVFRD